MIENQESQAPEQIDVTGGVVVTENGYLDEDTGELYIALPSEEAPTLEAAEQAAMFYYYNLKAIDRLDEQIKALQEKKATRERRRDFLKGQYLGPFKLLFQQLKEKTKFKGQSVTVGLITVKLSNKSAGFEVAEPAKVLPIVPTATRVTFDLGEKAPQNLVRQIAALAKSFPDAIKEVKVLKKAIPADKVEALAKAGAVTKTEKEEVWDLS